MVAETTETAPSIEPAVVVAPVYSPVPIPVPAVAAPAPMVIPVIPQPPVVRVEEVIKNPEPVVTPEKKEEFVKSELVGRELNLAKASS